MKEDDEGEDEEKEDEEGEDEGEKVVFNSMSIHDMI